MRKIATMMRITLNGEALNNEGNIGNVLQPRTIELADGTLRQAISGEMLKHFFTKNLRLKADDTELCDTCRIFSPMKNGKVKEVDNKFSASGNRVKECIIDDVCGFMNAGKGRNEKRHSVIKFSWAIATEENDSQTMLHSRVEPLSEKNKKNKKEQLQDNEEGTLSEGNTIKEQNTQMIFYRPIRSNEYAITIEMELDRIGLDEENENLPYVLNEEGIKERQRKALQSLKNMFIDMEGALCSTRLPHIMDIKGIIVDKTDKNDVLVKYSALNDDWMKVNKNIATNSIEFNNIEEFCKVVDELV